MCRAASSAEAANLTMTVPSNRPHPALGSLRPATKIAAGAWVPLHLAVAEHRTRCQRQIDLSNLVIDNGLHCLGLRVAEALQRHKYISDDLPSCLLQPQLALVGPLGCEFGPPRGHNPFPVLLHTIDCIVNFLRNQDCDSFLFNACLYHPQLHFANRARRYVAGQWRFRARSRRVDHQSRFPAERPIDLR